MEIERGGNLGEGVEGGAVRKRPVSDVGEPACVRGDAPAVSGSLNRHFVVATEPCYPTEIEWVFQRKRPISVAMAPRGTDLSAAPSLTASLGMP